MSTARSTPRAIRGVLVSLVAALLAMAAPAARAAVGSVGCDVSALIGTLTTANGSAEPDTIQLAPGCTYTLTTVNNTVAGPNGLPFITSSITIEGHGAIIARSSAPGTPAFRIFTIAGSGTLTLNNLTVTGGKTADGSTGSAGGIGGAIFNTGTLTLSTSRITHNATGAGGDGASGSAGGSGGNGGGISNTGTLTLIDSTVSNNTTGAGGAGTAASGGSGGFGGGIFNTGTLRVIASTVSGNTTGAGGSGSSRGLGGFGGGIASIASTSALSLSRSTVSGNTSSAGGPGGGIFTGGAATLTSSTLTANTAGTNGGGITNSGGTLSTLNTIIAGNTDSSGPNPDMSGTLTSQGYNLIGNVGTTSFTSNTTGDQYGDPNTTTVPNPGARESATPIAARLGPLAANGGLSPTHALLAGSPALDQGRCGAPATDQRGRPRPFDSPTIANATNGDGCDIGAFEAVSLVYLPLIIR